MAWDTSMLTPKAVRMLQEGHSPASVAVAFGLLHEHGAEAVMQYARKFDAMGRQIAQNGPANDEVNNG